MTFWTKSFILLYMISLVSADKWIRRTRSTEEKDIRTCYAHLGCVNITKDWYHEKYRPVNLKPMERHVVNTKFLFLSPCPTEPNSLIFDIISANPDSVNITNYDPKYSLVLLIHDFTSNGYTGWIKHLALILFKKEQYNVISVDWQAGAEPPYDQAISNGRLVALEAICLLKMLENRFSLKKELTHIIGHGVGAHIAGYIGKSIPHIGRITALDPSGPRFEGMPCIVKLSVSDSLYVDVIHTDGEGSNRQGTMEPMGNVDYYFNDGHDQPGCKICTEYRTLSKLTRCELPLGRIYPGCSHKRAFKYFIEAIGATQCQFIGFRANNYEEFLKAGCINCHEVEHVLCATLGMETNLHYGRQINAKMYLQTADRLPYCMNPYQVTLNMADTEKADQEIYGYFDMYMKDENSNVIANASFNKINSRPVQHGKNETFIAYSTSFGMDNLKELKLKWTHAPRPFCIGCNNNAYVYNMTVTHFKTTIIGMPEVHNDFCSKNCNITELINGCPATMVKCKYDY